MIGARRQRGSAVVLMVMVMSVACVAVLVAAAVGHARITGNRVRSMADTAAVSAAVALGDGHANPCSAARRVARADGADISVCKVEGEDVTVSVRYEYRHGFGMVIVKTSRAGPVACG
ncbi:Rv3654c family TadE-like protein [Bifidobacterium apri]|uniref:Pilus biosynthesis protein TadE n=1 Tax=Bifidobacterium apri TaxID=1769423 RepID=A0A6A2VFI6_9BIFI|nr:Rv3654c family TadE-like protein [Bifidobacterium apri]KAB8299459.1 hypothetical protein DSM100238_0891 [Bifidobacterium apri]